MNATTRLLAGAVVAGALIYSSAGMAEAAQPARPPSSVASPAGATTQATQRKQPRTSRVALPSAGRKDEIGASVTTVTTPRVHNNYLTLFSSRQHWDYPHRPTVSFTAGSAHLISPNQTWSGLSSRVANPYEVVVDAKASRSSTTQVAQWFNEQAQNNSQYADSYFDSKPKRLDFAFDGTLTIDGHPYPVEFGLGNYWPDSHNWWIAGRKSSSSQEWAKVGDVLVTPGGKYQLSFQRGDAFNISRID